MKSRELEARSIKRAEQAAAVGNLMLGHFSDWRDFLKPDLSDYVSLPRRQLKSGIYDVRNRLQQEITSFLDRNFVRATEDVLVNLYEDIKASRGIEVPLRDFESRYAKIQPQVLKNNPAHLTVSITLWGLQFIFPEDKLSKDVRVSLALLLESGEKLATYSTKTQQYLVAEKAEIALQLQKHEFFKRSLVLCCFNLIECFLNGIGWDFYQNPNRGPLSNKQEKVLTGAPGVKFSDRLTKVPKIVTGEEFSLGEDGNKILDVLKPFRDSLVHASPFSRSVDFGGSEKLRRIYNLNLTTAYDAPVQLISLIERIFRHVHKVDKYPDWAAELRSDIECAKPKIDQLTRHIQRG